MNPGPQERVGADHGKERRELSHGAKRSVNLQPGCHRTSLRDQQPVSESHAESHRGGDWWTAASV